MRYLKLKLICVLLLLFQLYGVYAQEVITATSGKAEGNGGTASYSIGQVVYSSYTGNYYSITEGVQQPFEISVVSGIEDSKSINLSILVQPNPTTDYLHLRINEYEKSDLSFQLYSTDGKLVQQEKNIRDESTIYVGNLKAAIYFLKVLQNNKELSTFKIVKK